MASPRAKAVCILRRDDEILVIPGHDHVRDLGFFIPPGGGIEFGEHSAEAAVREVGEELGVAVEAPELLGVFENVFEYQGRPEHEIIFAYSAVFADRSLYERGRFDGVESNGAGFVAEWVSLATFASAENVLFPQGLLALLR